MSSDLLTVATGVNLTTVAAGVATAPIQTNTIGFISPTQMFTEISAINEINIHSLQKQPIYKTISGIYFLFKNDELVYIGKSIRSCIDSV